MEGTWFPSSLACFKEPLELEIRQSITILQMQTRSDDKSSQMQRPTTASDDIFSPFVRVFRFVGSVLFRAGTFVHRFQIGSSANNNRDHQ